MAHVTSSSRCMRNEDLQEERQFSERRWSKREKQLQRVISNTSGMYGDLQGFIGSALRTIRR